MTQFLAAVEAGPARPAPRVPLDALVGAACQAVGVDRAMLAGGGRRQAAVAARAGIAYLWMEVLGHPGRALATALGTRPAAVYKAAARGRRTGTRWRRVLAGVSKET